MGALGPAQVPPPAREKRAPRPKSAERLHMPLNLSDVVGLSINPDSNYEAIKTEAIYERKVEDAFAAVQRLARQEQATEYEHPLEAEQQRSWWDTHENLATPSKSGSERAMVKASGLP